MGQENIKREGSEICDILLSALRSGDIVAADGLRSDALSILDESSPLLHCVFAVFHSNSGRLLDAIASARRSAAALSSDLDSSLFYARLLFHEGCVHDATIELHRALLLLCSSTNLTPQHQEDAAVDDDDDEEEEAAQLDGVVPPRNQEAASENDEAADALGPIPGLTRYTRNKVSDLTITHHHHQPKERTLIEIDDGALLQDDTLGPIPGLTRYTRNKVSDLTITHQQQPKERTLIEIDDGALLQDDTLGPIPELSRYYKISSRQIPLSNITNTQEPTFGDEEEEEKQEKKLKEGNGAQRIKAQVREFLDYQIRNKQRRFLTVDSNEFKTLLLTDPSATAENKAAANHILEALNIPKHSFTFNLCCSCRAKFVVDSDSLIAHVENTHLPIQETDIDAEAIPDQLDPSTAAEIARSTTWKPINIEATLKVLDKFPHRPDPIKLSRNPERIRLLSEIGESLRKLMDRQCLSPRHVSSVLTIATVGTDHDSRLRNYGANAESLRCVCFADAQQLMQINVLTSDLLKNYEQSTAVDDSYPSEVGDQVCPFVSHDEKIVLLDLKSLSAILGHEDINVDAVVEWLYSVPGNIPAFSDWISVKDERRSLGVKFLVSLRKLLKLLQGDCEDKLEAEREWNSSGAILRICKDERKRSVQSNSQSPSYKVLLQQKLDEEMEDVDRETISNVLTLAADFEGGLTALNRWEVELENASILTTVHKLRALLVVKLGVLDVKISGHLSRIQRLKDHIVRASSLNYLPIVLPPLRMLLQAKIEAEAKEFAENKSREISTALF